jgi:hypothetical protein
VEERAKQKLARRHPPHRLIHAVPDVLAGGVLHLALLVEVGDDGNAEALGEARRAQRVSGGRGGGGAATAAAPCKKEQRAHNDHGQRRAHQVALRRRRVRVGVPGYLLLRKKTFHGRVKV